MQEYPQSETRAIAINGPSKEENKPHWSEARWWWPSEEGNLLVLDFSFYFYDFTHTKKQSDPTKIRKINPQPPYGTEGGSRGILYGAVFLSSSGSRGEQACVLLLSPLPVRRRAGSGGFSFFFSRLFPDFFSFSFCLLRFPFFRPFLSWFSFFLFRALSPVFFLFSVFFSRFCPFLFHFPSLFFFLLVLLRTGFLILFFPHHFFLSFLFYFLYFSILYFQRFFLY